MATPPKLSPRIMQPLEQAWITINMIRAAYGVDWLKSQETNINGAHFNLPPPKPTLKKDVKGRRQRQNARIRLPLIHVETGL